MVHINFACEPLSRRCRSTVENEPTVTLGSKSHPSDLREGNLGRKMSVLFFRDSMLLQCVWSCSRKICVMTVKCHGDGNRLILYSPHWGSGELKYQSESKCCVHCFCLSSLSVMVVNERLGRPSYPFSWYRLIWWRASSDNWGSVGFLVVMQYYRCFKCQSLCDCHCRVIDLCVNCNAPRFQQ